MCCIYGDGYISVNTGSNIVETSGVFSAETSLDFDVTSNWASQGIRRHVYAHTVAMRLTINYDSRPKDVSWKLVDDENGSVVDESSAGTHTTPGIMTREYYHLRPGWYWFSIADESVDGITGGYAQIDQVDDGGNVLSNKFYSDGNFGAFKEDDFYLV